MARRELPHRFRKMSIEERRRCVEDVLGLTSDELASTSADGGLLDLADAMVESAVGYLPVPLGLATGFLIDGQEIIIPLATEEQSVVAEPSTCSFATLITPAAARSISGIPPDRHRYQPLT